MDMSTTRRPNGRRRTAWLAAAVVASTVALTACEGVIYVHVDDARTAAGQPVLARSELVAQRARQTSAAMCTAGAVTPSADPTDAYDPTTIAAATELVGAAELDPTIADPDARNQAATAEIWSGWQDDPALVGAEWDAMGVGEAECADGNLYLTAALTDGPTMPATGRFASQVHTDADLQTITGLQYGTAVNAQGQTQNLLLDVYLPPATGQPRPLAILVHGGSFISGNRSQMATQARSYARRGYVAASISYRLNPAMGTNPAPAVFLDTAFKAVDDGMESVRWLRANAATLGIDPTRVAMVGSSAGGAIALGVGAIEDASPGGPLAAHSPRIQAAVSTGANLTPGLAAITFTSTDSPSLLFHHETDSVTAMTAADAAATCTALQGAGGTCDLEVQPGSGHTTSITAGGTWWAPRIGPFLWTHLDLEALS
jgi:acetyl esterase/lipase